MYYKESTRCGGVGTGFCDLTCGFLHKDCVHIAERHEGNGSNIYIYIYIFYRFFNIFFPRKNVLNVFLPLEAY